MSDPMPPTPNDAAKAALAENAKGMAQDAFMRRVRTAARQKLPRPLYDMIFRGKSAGELAEDEARRRVRNIIWSCSFFLVFTMLVAGVAAFVVVVVAWALMFG